MTERRARRVGRLRRRVEFQTVLTRGTRVEHSLLVMRVLPPPPDATGPPAMGIVAGKRVGGAVVRNRARRRVRAALREMLAAVTEPWRIVVLLRAAAGTATYRAVWEACGRSLSKAKVLRS